jgi:hypothetical protein
MSKRERHAVVIPVDKDLYRRHFYYSLWTLGMKKLKVFMLQTAAVQNQVMWDKKLLCVPDTTNQLSPKTYIKVESCV